MRQTERHREILRILDHKPLASVDDLCAVLGASPATVRRDLKTLAGSGKIVRVHGGAEPSTEVERLRGTPFSRNVTVNVAAKRAIAKAAADSCIDGESIIVDAGSTTYFMCSYLRGRKLQVLTNSIPIVQELLTDPTLRLHIPGGEIFREQNIILSTFVNNGVSQYSASKMFIGAGAVNARGLLQTDSILVQAEQRLKARADELIVVADSSKFSSNASLIVCGLEEVDRVITDERVSSDTVRMLEDHGVDVEIASL